MQHPDRPNPPAEFVGCSFYSLEQMTPPYFGIDAARSPDMLRNALAPAPRKKCIPSVSLLQGMRWVSSHQTDIRATLDKARAELEKR